VLLTAQTVTFNKQIAPIIFNNCSSCHRPGEAAPFSLLSYKDVVPKARLIAAVTSSRQMPPWKAEPASYPYRDERRLTDSQIAMIRDWVKQGMPEGKTEDRPEPPKFSSGWMLGEPDLVVEMPAGYHVPADGPDIYRNIVIPLGLKEDKWVTAIDMRPSARSVVHHVLYFGDPEGKIHERPQEGAEPGFSGMRAGGATVPLGGWAVGAQPHFFPDDLALEVAKGSDLVIQYHFHPTGKAEIEKSTVALYFAKTPPERRLISVQLARLLVVCGIEHTARREGLRRPRLLHAAGCHGRSGCGRARALHREKAQAHSHAAQRRNQNHADDRRLGLCLAGSLFLSAIDSTPERNAA